MKKGIIIGAGIGGLTTSIALAKKGILTEVFEQSDALGEVGAGIWVAPNGLKIYQKLGLSDEIIRAGNILDKISIVDLRHKPITVIDGNDVYERHQFKTVAIHRADLHKLLISKINPSSIHLGKKLKSITQNRDRVTARFDDGTSFSGDFIICADGINSVGREKIHSKLNLRYSGQSCWRFITDYQFRPDENGKMYEIWSNKKGLRVGYSKINATQAYVFITNFEKPGGSDNKHTIKNDLIKMCTDFPETVQNLISLCNSEDILRNDLFDFAPIKKWVEGNLALLGDAAHATTPNLGQGACQAIEDAWVIAKMLSAHDSISEAFTAYENLRWEKASFVTQTSYRFSVVTNMSGIAKSLMKFIIRLTPYNVNNKQLDKIYSVID